MWDALPNELKLVVLDFYGDCSLLRHRRNRFVQAEITTFQGFARDWEFPFVPSFVCSVGGFKEALELAYLYAQTEPIVKRSL